MEELTTMNIGIIGSGHIGATLSRLFTAAGHKVALSNSRAPETLHAKIAELGGAVLAVGVEEAARFGELVVLAIPFKAFHSLTPEAFAGKVVIDATNYYPQRDGHFSDVDSGDRTSSELIAAHLPSARIVKAFNTMNYQPLGTSGNIQLPSDDRLALFLSGDDPKSNELVSHLIEQIGFTPIKTGNLRDGGRLQQPGSAIYNRPMSAKQAKAVVAG